VPVLNDTPVPAVKLNKLPPSATPDMVLLVNALLGIDVRLAPDPLNDVAVTELANVAAEF
jgi:hypothetical protein